jgi:endonuclease YncB( thermonuclease family)
MFKGLRYLLFVALALIVSGVVYHFVGDGERRRVLTQRTEEIREQLKGEKPFAWTGTAVVVDAIKGDRATVDTEANHKVIVRLAGIDAPELPVNQTRKGQPFAEESRDHLAQLVKGKAVDMAIIGPDPEKHPLVLLTLDGTLINAKIVEAGLAEFAGETSSGIPVKLRHEIENAELKAKQEHLGIWTLTNYMRPLEFRIRERTTASGRYGTD